MPSHQQRSGAKERIVPSADVCGGARLQLLLDEPTNHLDIEAIDSLAQAIKGYKGGLVVSPPPPPPLTIPPIREVFVIPPIT